MLQRDKKAEELVLRAEEHAREHSYEKAFKSHKAAYGRWIELGANTQAATSAKDAGELLVNRLNQAEDAIKWFKRSIDARGGKQISPDWFSAQMANIAVCLQELGRNDEAVDHLLECKEILRNQPYGRGFSIVSLSLIRCLARLRKKDEAHEEAISAIKVASDAGDLKWAAKIRDEMNEIFPDIQVSIPFGKLNEASQRIISAEQEYIQQKGKRIRVCSKMVQRSQSQMAAKVTRSK